MQGNKIRRKFKLFFLCEMNGSFENIFEKYNVKCKMSRKRHKSPKKQTIHFHKKKLPIMAKDCAGTSTSFGFSNASKTLFSNSCYFNKHSKTKYNTPTRYTKLDVIESGLKHRNSEKVYSCDNKEICNVPVLRDTNLSKSWEHNLKNVSSSDNQTKKLVKISDDKSQLNNLETPMEFDQSNDFSKLNGSNFSNLSFMEETENCITQSVQTEATELDLLIDLIEQQNAAINGYAMQKQARKFLNYNDGLLVTKPRLKGGLQEIFERALKHEQAKNNFLEYDKKIGLRVGQVLTVIKVETSHGLTFAIVQSRDIIKEFAVVVTREMMLHIKPGCQIETFFDDKTLPYKLLLNGEYLDVYLEPYKLLTLK